MPAFRRRHVPDEVALDETVMRYNGIVIPYGHGGADVTARDAVPASNAQGEIILDHMPAGVYEFWPVGSPEELREVAAGVGPSAPVRMPPRRGKTWQ
jgi:hypothetical protein